MDPSPQSRSAKGMSALVRRVFGAGPRLKKRCKRVSAEEQQQDYVSSKGSSISSSSTDGWTEMETERESEDVVKKRPVRMRHRVFRKQGMYQRSTWIRSRPRLAFSCLRIRILHMVRLVKTMVFLRRLRNTCMRLMRAAGSSKAVISLTDLYYAIAELIPRAGDEEKCPPANNIIVLRPIMLQSNEKGNLTSSLRNRPDIQALKDSLNLQALISGALIRTNSPVS